MPLLVGAVTACATSRVPTEASFRFGTIVACDLDGNGVADRVTVHGMSEDGFEVRIGNLRLRARGDFVDSTFALVDIDTSDARVEVAVTEQGPSDDDATHFFTYDGDSIRSVGTLPGSYEISIDGSGIVRSSSRGKILHTWFHPAFWRLDPSHQLVPIEMAMYPMNASVTMRRPMTLRRAPTDARVAVRLQAGERVTILSSDDRRWCLVRAASGATGWFEVENLWRVDGRDAGEVFEGLSGADSRNEHAQGMFMSVHENLLQSKS